MRISDWSSDVCSSDLRPGRLPLAVASPTSRFSGAWNTCVALPAASTSMMPTPVHCEPGSMPRMRVIAGPLSLEGDLQERLQPLPRDRLPSTVRVLAQLGIAVDVLHVVQVFEPVEQLDDQIGRAHV